MSSGAATARGRERLIEDALRSRWRIIDQVRLAPCADGNGFAATIHLHRYIVEGAADQQGLWHSPASAEAAWQRRLAEISSCVEEVNAGLPAAEAIREFEVV